jgi:chromosomal replication initiator protein
MLAMWLSRRHTSNALSEIGDYFGGRSHSTVVAAEKRVEQWLEAGGKIELEGGVVPVSDALQLLARRLRVG